MKSFKIKLKGFTILELLVGMIIGAMVVLFSFYILEEAHKSYFYFRKTGDAIEEYTLFSSLVQQDFANAQYCKREHNELICLSPEQTIRYQFLDSIVLRVNSKQLEFTDTLQIVSMLHESYFEQSPKSNNLIDEQVIKLKPYDKEYSIYLRKVYSAEELMHYFHLPSQQ